MQRAQRSRPWAALAAIALALTLAGCTALALPETTTAPPADTPPPVALDLAAGIVAEARVVPVRTATLSLTTGGLVAEVLVAEGQQVQAGDLLLRLDRTALDAQVAEAQAGLARAVAYRNELAAGARPQEIAAMEAQLAAANAARAKAMETANEPTLAGARAEVANAEAAVAQAQAAWDRVKWEPGAEARPEALVLQQATNNLAAARARLDGLQRVPSQASVAMADADIQRIQAELDLLRAGARPETLAVAEADVAVAQASLDRAIAALPTVELRAPFTGTVVHLDVSAGEFVTPGAGLVLLADTSTWQVETTDLTELGVVGIHEGQAARVTFDALPGVETTGVIAYVSPLGESDRGEIVYRAVVRLDAQDARLRWNMTALVTVAPE